jgi:acyl-CoA thioester hydrolase
MLSHAMSGWKDGWYTVPHEVTWRDLDAAGHVNNAVFLTYFEHGRTAYWLEMTAGESPGDIGFIVARTECDFIRQLSLRERIEIGTRIGRIGNTSIEFDSEVRLRDGELVARGRVVVVHFSWQANRKQPIPEELTKRIAEFQREAVPADR